MSQTIQERLKLKRTPTDIWSTKEQLYLASSVLRSGESNWVNVSRSLKQILDKDASKSPDWLSHKSCAQQYAYLLENADLPKRKKRDSGETTSEFIVRQLTEKRIEELKNTLQMQKIQYFNIKNEINLLRNGTISEEKLQKMWLAIQEEEEREQKKLQASTTFSSKRQQGSREAQFPPTLVIDSTSCDVATPSTSATPDFVATTVEEEDKIKGEKSPLLTSLLKSTSPTIQTQNISQSDSPMIERLLSSGPQQSKTATATSNNQLTVTEKCMNTVNNAPVLSMFLEQPSTSTQKIVLVTQSLPQTDCAPSTSSQVNIQDMTPAVTLVEKVPSSQTETVSVFETNLQQLATPEVLAQPEPMDKDEINEIIGDIEEIIEKEIPLHVTEAQEIENVINEKPPSSVSTERCEPRNIDEPISLSNSPVSEIAIEEIDSSTSNIAEIIGTAIEHVPTNTIVPDQSVTIQSTEEPEEKLSESNNFDSIEIQQNSSEIISESNIDSALQDSVQIIFTESLNASVDKISSKEMEGNGRAQIVSINDSSLEKSTAAENNESVIEEVDLKDDTEDFEDIDSNLLDPKIIHASSGQFRELSKEREIFEKSKLENQKEEKVKNSANESVEILDADDVIEKIEKDKEDNSAISDGWCQIELSNKKQNIEDSSIDNGIHEIVIETDIVSFNEKDGKPKSDSDKTSNIIGLDVNELSTIIKTKTDQVPSKVKKNVEDIEKELDIKKEKDSNSTTDIAAAKVNKDNTIDISESIDDLDENEPTCNKLSSGRAIRTYSKKQIIDTEVENETSNETAEFHKWKKALLLIYNEIASHKYASLFAKPITEDQAPGYHSLIFRPMDLQTIKKNIDNGNIRTMTHFRRDIMLMFQNAIMYNKHNSQVHKMALQMQEKSMQLMQDLDQNSSESFRRETRTAASSNSMDSFDSNVKRKSALPGDSDHQRTKKTRKSEVD